MAKMNKNANYVTEKRQMANQASAKAKSSKKAKGVTKNVLLIVAIVLAVAALVAAFVGMVSLPLLRARNNQREFLNPYEGHFEVTDVVELEFEGYGKVTIELYGKEAPKTVENFLHLVEHGEITAESIAVASSTSDYFITVSMPHDHEEEGHEHTYIKGEFYDNGVANRIQHVSGVLTMSNGSTKYNSSSTDFKIITNALNKNYNTEKSSGYNGNYAAFGKVDAEGLKVVRQIVTDYREKASSTTTDANALVFGSNKISVTSTDIAKKTIEKTFTPTNSGTYTFKSTKYTSIILDLVKEGAAAGAKSAEFGAEMTELKDGVSYDLVAGETYTITLGLGELKAGTHIITIEGELLLDGTNEIEITEEDVKNESVSYSYTPNYTGIHFFACQATTSSGKFGGSVEIFDGETSIGEDSAYLEKGKTYTFVVHTKDVEADDYKAVVTAPTLVTGDNALSVPEYTIRDGKAFYYFTPSEDAKYLINNKDLTVKVYDAEGNEVEGGNYVVLKKDETYKIEISADLDPVLGLGDTNIAITADNKKGDAKYEEEFSFTAEATGKYTFAGDNITSIDVWDSEKKLEKDENGAVSLKVGTTYTVAVGTIAEGSYKVSVSVEDPKDEDTVVVYASYTLTVQSPSLIVGSNKLTVTESDITATKVEYSFTATTNGVFSFTGIYQKLDENGKQATDKDGKTINVNAKLTLKDKDGNELNVENAKLVKGETYTVVLKSDLIRKDAVATITVAKTTPKIVSAKIVEE